MTPFIQGGGTDFRRWSHCVSQDASIVLP